MFDNDTHIGLLTASQIPDGLLDDFLAELEDESLNVQRIELPSLGPQASLEGYLITAVAIFLLRPYVSGFLDEAGRDHYHCLRRSLKKAWGRFFGEERELRVALLTSSGEKKPQHSIGFSIYFETPNGRKLKLLFPHDCSVEEYEAAIDAFLDLIEHFEWRKLSGVEGLSPEKISASGGHILVKYDVDDASLRVVDPLSRKKTNAQNRERTSTPEC